LRGFATFAILSALDAPDSAFDSLFDKKSSAICRAPNGSAYSFFSVLLLLTVTTPTFFAIKWRPHRAQRAHVQKVVN
jgi:hypothetical protein